MKTRLFDRLLCFAVIVVTCLTTMAQDFNGLWKGSIMTGSGTIPVVLNLQQNESGITATLDSPDQQAFGIKANATVDGDKLSVDVPEIAASYKATLKGNTLDGTYSQMGFTTALTLSREAVSAVSDDDGPVEVA